MDTNRQIRELKLASDKQTRKISELEQRLVRADLSLPWRDVKPKVLCDFEGATQQQFQGS